MAGSGADELCSLLQRYAGARGGGGAASSGPPTTAAATGAGAADDWRFDLIRSVGEECQTEQELRSLLQRKPEFFLYDGFEPSGRMHIAQGVFKAINVNKCTKAGGIFIFWVADWFALMNDKMGGDLEKIQTVGQYFIEVWKATGMDMSRVRFRWCAQDIVSHCKEYWTQALDIARRSTIARIKKCCQIMGRKEDSLSAAQIMYPIMQSTDIFFLQADICQLGVDQRKVNMLARDYCDSVGRKNKPIILSHHMLYGLSAGQAKMSKSNPDSAIFMEDTPEDVERKIRQAYCPVKPEAATVKAAEDEEMQLVKDDLMNPCLDYVKNILFSREGYTFQVGGTTFTKYEDVKAAFLEGAITEKALKDKLIEEVNALLVPVRKHFETDPHAKELLAKITAWKKETLTAPKTLTRLRPSPPFAGDVFAVFAPLPPAPPLPCESPRLDLVLAVLRRLREAPAAAQIVLWLEDWTAGTLGCLNGSEACIRGFYQLLVFALQVLAPEVMARVRVCWQGEMILSGPSEYWISVINTGRQCSLETIRAHLPHGRALEQASQVFASLMHVADVLAMTEASSLVLCADDYHENLHQLAAQQSEAFGTVRPSVERRDGADLRLLEGAGEEDTDAWIMVGEKEPDLNKKVKKCFCMPQNVEFNPPVAWVAELLPFAKEFVVTRKPDNGGDKTYTEVETLAADFASGALHPGDLKPALARALNALLEPLRKGLQEQAILKEALKELESYSKSQTRKKK